MSVLYTTTAVNCSGINGTVEIINPEKQTWDISSPFNKQSGTNPEQLLAASVATCLHASLQYVLAQEKITSESHVETQVDLLPDEVGYQFFVRAIVFLSKIKRVEANLLIEKARQECPLAKLIPTLQIDIQLEGEIA